MTKRKYQKPRMHELTVEEWCCIDFGVYAPPFARRVLIRFEGYDMLEPVFKLIGPWEVKDSYDH